MYNFFEKDEEELGNNPDGEEKHEPDVTKRRPSIRDFRSWCHHIQ